LYFGLIDKQKYTYKILKKSTFKFTTHYWWLCCW